MIFQDHIHQCAVIGAGGKMGRGISLMIIKLILKLNLDHVPKLLLIESQSEVFDDLRKYLNTQLQKLIKKDNCEWTSHLGENVEEREQTLNKLLEQILCFSTDFKDLKDRFIIFEAIPEIPSLKINIIKEIASYSDPNSYIFSNTSSIPIQYLEAQTQLRGRIVGFHFYNPPPVQDLLEVIHGPSPSQDLRELTDSIVKDLKKFPVPSNDIAGFIGNGHFIREGLSFLEQIDINQDAIKRCEQILELNIISEFGLLRPMGIFQLIDYVGLDIFKSITEVMREHLKQDDLNNDLLKHYIESNHKGGQDVQGGQRSGFFKYDKRQIVAIYDPISQKEYALDNNMQSHVLGNIGLKEFPILKWKDLVSHSELSTQLRTHFDLLIQSETHFACMSMRMLKSSHSIGQSLVDEGVAINKNDINNVMIKGFHHLFGPINDFGDHSQITTTEAS